LAKALNQQQYWDLTTQLCFISDTANGDGIRMGMEIGAALATVGGTIDFDAATGNATNNSLPQAPCVIVNANGQRFVCEDATYAYQYRAIFQQVTQLQGPAWMILDQNMVEQKYGSWSADIPGAIASGALVTANTYEALAAAIGVPTAAFVRTMDTWNMNIATYGADIDYQRDAQLIQLDKPPYYAAKIVAANLGSLGGLEIDAKAQVINLAGEVIPHLYAGGMNSGGWYGLYYPGSGTSLMGGLVLGRIAGASAAAATAWS
jgi:urocanate reductase